MRTDARSLSPEIGVRGFLTGAGLPLFLLAATLVHEVFLIAVMLAPESAGAWGGFAREFKQWCFSYDPRTGGMEWSAFWLMLVEPAFVVIVAALLSRRPLAALFAGGGWLRHWKSAVAGGAMGSLLMSGLYAYGRPDADADAPLPFPGERIRTHLRPPPFQCTDQTGAPFSLDQMRGRVVLLTAVYATCPTGACSAILRETRALLDELPPSARARLSVAALSLNPDQDTDDLRRRVCSAYRFTHPEFRYLNGDPEVVRDATTRLGFAPALDPATGVINHANLFLLIDAHGEIAYRLTLDERHRSWLRQGLITLAAEAGAL